MKFSNISRVKVILGLLLFAFLLQCSKPKKEDNSGLLGLLFLNTSQVALATNPYSSSVPSDLAIASVTAQQTTTSSQVRDLQGRADATEAGDFRSKRRKLAGALNATTLADCFGALPKFFKQNSENVNCYGPSLSYTSHTEITGNNQNSFPGGDLGIWTPTAGSNNEACAAAKVNALVDFFSNRVDFALGTAAFLGCVAKLSNLSPPAIGSTQSLTSIVANNAQVKDRKFTISKAEISRGANSSDGRPNFTMVFEGSREQPLPSGGVFNSTIQITLKQSPNTELNPTSYKGLLQMVIDDQDPVSRSSGKRALAVIYDRGATSTSYKGTTGVFAATATTLFNSTTGDVISTPDSNGVNGFRHDYNRMIATVDNTTGLGSLAYGWQAGSGDGFLRVFNAETTSANTGNAFFGFSTNANGTGDLAIDGMFCNWIGKPGNSSSPTSTLVQKQTLTLNSGIWRAGTSNITFAPTNNCNHASAGAVYAGLQAITGSSVSGNAAVTNDLVPIAQYSFTQPTAPSFP